MWESVNFAIDVIFLCDIALNLRTGYVSEGVYVSEASLVAKHYLFSAHFVIDAASSFPFSWLPLEADVGSAEDTVMRLNTLLRLLRLFKLLRMIRIDSMLKRSLLRGSTLLMFNPGLLRLGKVFVALVLTCHLAGTAWWLVADLELRAANATATDLETDPLGTDDDALLYAVPPTALRALGPPRSSWVPSEWLVAQTFSTRYLHAFLWGASMMTGFVPFDVEPESASEVLVTIISLFFGFITQCVIISSATSALQAVDSKDMAAKQRLDSITQWLAFKRVPAELRMRILEFFEYSLARAGEDSELMRGLPAHLAMMLSISMNKQLILQCPVFHSLKNTEIMKLLAKLEPRIFVPGQVIIREGEKNRSLFFINRGVVRVVRGLDDPDDEPEVIDMLVRRARA